LQVIKRCKEAGIESVYDIMEMEDDQRNTVLQMDARQMRDVATFVNSYPTLDVNYKLAPGEYTAGTPIQITVQLSKDADEEESSEDDQNVIAPFFPVKKMANWWLVIGEPSSRTLHAIKRVTVTKSLAMKLEFTLPKGEHKLKLYVICDSYIGADHDIDLEPIDVAEGEESDSDEEMESGSEMEE
jgi:pre-mRNA-splicing helicase BRR2